MPLKHVDDRKEDDTDNFYGVVDGAHRLGGLMLLVADEDYPKYTLDFLVPCQVLKGDIPDELVIAIASREFECSICLFQSVQISI